MEKEGLLAGDQVLGGCLRKQLAQSLQEHPHEADQYAQAVADQDGAQAGMVGGDSRMAHAFPYSMGKRYTYAALERWSDIRQIHQEISACALQWKMSGRGRAWAVPLRS